MTDINKFMMKKVVKKMYTMKIMEIGTWLSFFITKSSPTASIPHFVVLAVADLRMAF